MHQLIRITSDRHHMKGQLAMTSSPAPDQGAFYCRVLSPLAQHSDLPDEVKDLGQHHGALTRVNWGEYEPDPAAQAIYDNRPQKGVNNAEKAAH